MPGFFSGGRGRRNGSLFVTATGLLLAALALGHLSMEDTTAEVLVGVVPPMALSAGIVYAGYRLWRSDLDGGKVWRVAAWMVTGLAFLASGSLFSLLHQLVEGVAVVEVFGVVSNSATGGATAGLLAGLYDVRMRLRGERELRRSRAKYRALFENLNDAAFVVDAESGRIVAANERAGDLLGMDVDEVVGMHQMEVHPEEDRDVYRERFERYVGEGSLRDYEAEIVRSDGERVPVHISGRTFRLDDRELSLGLFEDVSELRKAQEELRESEERYSTLVEECNDGIVIIRDGEIVFANQKMEEMTGHSKIELEGMAVSECVSPEHGESAVEMMARGGERFETELHRSDGSRVQVEVNPSRITYEGSPATEAIVRDITEQKRLEERLKESRDKLAVLNRILRHDIRNDMQLVTGWVGTLEEGAEGEEAERLKRVREASIDVIDLTRTSRDIARVLEGEEPEAGSIDLRDVLRREVEKAGERYRGASFEVEEPPDVEVVGDEMLSSVFRNLLNNAVQHNDEEQPRVEVSAEVGDGEVVACVEDNGPGVPPDEREEIFERSEKGLDSEGTGIGLYLVKTLVDRYGGDVRVEDSELGGAAFCIGLDPA